MGAPNSPPAKHGSRDLPFSHWVDHTRDFAQGLPYSSWRRHHTPVSLRPFGGAVEPLVHAPEAVHSARIGRIAVVDNAVLDHEGAQARPAARVRGRAGS